MNKKNVATTIVLILSAMIFTVVGSCFMNFIYKDSKIVITDPNVVASSGVLVYDSKDDNKTAISKLKFSDMSLGLKPVTGQADAETNIPSTVTDKNGSEGVYSSVKITAPAGLKIIVKNIKVESGEDAQKIKEERKNMFVALKDIKDSANNLEKDELILTTFEDAVADKEVTLFFWLDGKADKILKGSKISFEVYFTN